MEGTKMQCPQCQFENREEAQFCSECGHKFELFCPECGNTIRTSSKFCDGCGCKLEAPLETFENVSETESPPPQPAVDIKPNDVAPIDGERKHVTVLFSDLTGYTAMSEKLDPEEVKEITSRIFGEISKIIANYDGFIEKYAGDAVMAIFGVPKAHEDDPIRAIKAAREIHQRVDAISPDVEKKIGQSISMHTGINTGLVVTGEVNMERGTHGIAGDTINLASRLSGLAKPGEILVNVDTCHQIEGHFACEYIETTTVKGKTDPVQVHKVLYQRDKPVTIHRLSGMRSDLVGRNVELAELSEAVDNLRQGKGRTISICGAAGTGKSRLVEEFKAGLDLGQIQWIEGHAYAYSQDIPYFPLVDLLNRLLDIKENDLSEKVREKVESGLQSLVGNQEDIIPYVGGLYSLSYPETNDVSPEFWKSRLQAATLAILEAMAKRAPTVFFLEDLHWADPSFVEFLQRACLEIRQPAIVLCAYRPTFSLFTGHQVSNIGKNYHDIQLENLSLSVAQNMLASLLKTETIPPDLKRWVQSKAEGNPFYLEELVNSLIESDTLTRDNGSWKLTRSIAGSDIPSSLHGLITGRLDRLDKQTKRILQKASVIGRDFLYEILKRISELKERIDGELSNLERLDLIRARSLQPDLEYMFKHALTHEIVYNGVLKKQRREIHEQIARVIESVFKDRLAEFNETLAYHFTRGQSAAKAVDYLVKSGEKSLRRYALEESHQYYQEAFKLLADQPDPSEADKELLIDILIKWAYVYYYRGDFKSLVELFRQNELIAKSLSDKIKRGFFHAWLGMALWMRENLKESENYLREALELGHASEDQKLIGYACCWLSMTCSDLGLLDEALELAERGHEVARQLGSDHYLYFKSLHAKGFAYYYMGYCKENLQIGKTLLNYGNKHSNSRCLVLGHMSISFAHSVAGNPALALEASKEAVKVSADPVYSIIPNPIAAFSYLQMGEFKEAKKIAEASLAFSEKFGCEFHGTAASIILAGVMIANGKMAMGLKRIEDILQRFREVEKKSWIPTVEHILGKIYFQIYTGEGPVRLATLLRNAVFLTKTMPFASKRAEYHFNKAVELANEIGAKGLMGQAYLDLGLLHIAKKRSAQANECISIAIKIFEECEAEVYLKQANEAFKSLQ
jgi:class 3 adenylate cyclase/tetratricopeptide (TPR) repeat protein